MMLKKIRIYILSTILITSISSIAQNQSVMILFVGNSYTYVNNLPKMLSDVANSTNDTIIYDSSTPGGHTLQAHSTNSATLSKIAQANWDYVVLQDQSQRPSFPDAQVQVEVFPYARTLDSLINVADSCTETVFYMTWGRENGDASNCGFWPPVCTYEGMDSLLNLRYRQLADTNNALVSPVGAVWNYIRVNHPTIDLYSSDGSHPSVRGTYAAACTFYSILLRKDPTLITFNSSLSTTEANQIKAAVKAIAYDSLTNWHVGEYDVSAEYSFVQNNNQVSFTSSTNQTGIHFWDFGDGTTSAIVNPINTYSTVGSYNVLHTITHCNKTDSITKTVDINTIGVDELVGNVIAIQVYPNPFTEWIVVNNQIETDLTYELIGINGALITKGVIEKGENRLSFTNLEKGNYVLNIYSGNQLIQSTIQVKE